MKLQISNKIRPYALTTTELEFELDGNHIGVELEDGTMLKLRETMDGLEITDVSRDVNIQCINIEVVSGDRVVVYTKC